MHRLLPILLVLIAADRSVAFAQASQSTNQGQISGAVVDKASGRAVPGAVVTVEGMGLSATTNAGGRFMFESVASPQATLVVRAPGFLELRLPGVTVGSPITIELDPTPNYMERVQVTATKTPLSIGDVAAGTDVVTRAMLESRGVQTLPQALAHIPGAYVSTELGIFDSVMLRGMPRGDPEFTNTLLLIDGVPQTLSNNGARVVALPIYDANSIEIVRGPNSALYGRTAIGGSVNILTADPTPQRELALDLTGGELGMLKGAARVSGPLSRWGGYYVSVGAERQSGYFKTQTDPDFMTGNRSVFGKLTFSPDSRGFGGLSVNHVRSDNSTPTNEPIIDGRLLHEIDPRFDRFASFNLPGPTYLQRESRVTLNYSRELTPAVKLVEVFGYRSVLHEFREDADFIGTPYDLAAATVAQYPFSQTLDENILFQELRLEMAPRLGSLKNLLTVGGSYEHDTGSIVSDFIYTDEDLFGWPISYLDPVFPDRSLWQHDTGFRNYHLGITGLFGQYMLEPAARIVITAGGRYDRLDMDNARDGGVKAEDTFDAFSPKASVTYKLSGLGGSDRPAVNIYGTYSQAFLPPRRPSSLVPSDVPLELKPENIENYEGGVKASLLGNRLSLDASFFYMLEDGVVLSIRQGPFFLPTNAGQQKYKGVETAASFALSPKASIYSNASFYRNRFADFVIESEDGDEVLTGNRLPFSPDYVVNWGASFAPTASVDATFSVKHVGDVQTSRENVSALDSYTLVDGGITWRRGALRVTLSAYNLFNTEYYWNGGSETVDPGRPRQVLLTTSVRFR